MRNTIAYTKCSHDEVCQKIYTESHSGAYVSYLRGKRFITEADCLREISASFQFPWYFGENWNALDECLADLEWLSFSRIVIVVDDFSLSFGRSFEIQDVLVRHLGYMLTAWEEEGISVEVWLNN